MKYLSEYMADGQSKAFEKAGAFFAFGNRQFDEAKKEWVRYVSLGGWLICPTNTAMELVKELNRIHEEAVKQDIAENWLNWIIRRELNNHEAYYTGDIESTVQALFAYPVTAEDILKVFKHKDYQPVIA